MAFTKSRAGDRWSINMVGTVVPKAFSGSYTGPTPAVGHLVKRDTAINDGVLQCGSGDEPYGMVLSVNSGNGTLSVLRFARIQSIVLEYASAPNRGDSIAANGSAGVIPIDGVLRDQIIADNSDGVGVVVALDEPVTGVCVVEFGGGVSVADL
jgi:hypothetical protein